MAKSLFTFLFILFSFGLMTQESVGKCHMTNVICHSLTRILYVMSHDGSHDKCGKIVHRPYSSYISSIQKINEDSIEFPCQLGVGLSHLD